MRFWKNEFGKLGRIRRRLWVGIWVRLRIRFWNFIFKFDFGIFIFIYVWEIMDSFIL